MGGAQQSQADPHSPRTLRRGGAWGPEEAQARPRAPEARPRLPRLGCPARGRLGAAAGSTGGSVRPAALGTGWASGRDRVSRPQQAGSPTGQAERDPPSGQSQGESGRQAQPESWLRASVSEAAGLLWLDGEPLSPDAAPVAVCSWGPTALVSGKEGMGMRTEWGAPGALPSPSRQGRCPPGPRTPSAPGSHQLGHGGAVCAPATLGPGLLASLAGRSKGAGAAGGVRSSPAQPVPGGPCGRTPNTERTSLLVTSQSLEAPPRAGVLGGVREVGGPLRSPCSGPHLGPLHEMGDPGTLPWGD